MDNSKPAFPLFAYVDKEDHSFQEGMSLREYYAGKAMQGLLSDVHTQFWLKIDPRYDGNNFAEVVAKNSVEFADALIKELSKPQPAQ